MSLVLDFCTETKEVSHVFVVQDDDSPKINELKGVGLYFYKYLIRLLSLIYKLPVPMYSFLWRLHSFEVKLTWRLQIMWFHLKQLGLKKFSLEFLNYVRNKIR